MAEDNYLRELSKDEDRIKFYWNSVIRHLRTDGKIDLAGINKKQDSRRNFLSSLGRVAAGATAASIISKSKMPKMQLFPSSAEALESKKYLSYEELMNLIKKYGYIYHDSNIKPGEVPRIIIFGEEHETSGIDYYKESFLKELFWRVDKDGKELVYLFEGKGGEITFLRTFPDFPFLDKARYIGVDTYRDSQKDSKYLSDYFKEIVLFAFTNELNDNLIKIKHMKDNLVIFLEVIEFVKNNDNCAIFLSVDNNQHNAFTRLLDMIPHKQHTTICSL